MKHYGDITKIDWATVAPVDCVTGGSPCQDLSVAGQRKGLDGERSGLFMEQIKCVKELRKNDIQRGRHGSDVRPRYMVWENVPGAFSSNKGKDFQTVLTEIVRVVEPDAPDVPLPDRGGWSKAGCLYGEMGTWSLAWRVHDAQFWGVPQRRKRIALVADFGGLSAPEILFERKGLSGDSEPGGAAREETAAPTGGGAEGASGAMNPWDSQSARVYPDNGVWHSLHLHGQRLRAERIKVPAIYDARGNGNGATVPTMTGDHQNRVTDYTALCVGNGQANQSVSDKAGALNTMHDQQAVLCYGLDCEHNAYKDQYGTMRAHSSGGAEHKVMVGTIVRRLTPLECERLQGYPDGWTDIGDWVDPKGKKHKGADSPRYKALGNSIALPFWFYLLRRISAQYERPATLGSLFDGIGGFPLCWERCNGKGTALWASEIEEFPMAVTKLRFGDG